MTRFDSRPLRTPRSALVLAVLVLPLFATGCGPDKPAEEPDADTDADTREDYDPTAHISATAEVGALPEEETVNAFKDSFPAIQECFIRGAQRIEFIGGEISFFIQVNSQGEAEYVYAKETTIGDRRTEKCMIDALRGASWPAPVGGLVGVAENSFGFEMTGDVRPPVYWDAEEVSEALSEHAASIAECKRGGYGTFSATVYVDSDGTAMGVGISAPDKESEVNSDCLVSVLEEITYPSPGSWPAKVTFRI